MKSCTANKTAFSAGAALSFLIIVALLSDPHPSDPHLRAVAGLLALVSCGVVAWRFRGEMVARRQAQAGLRQAQEELENRVAQRTAEVNTANVALQAEVLERQRAEAALRTTRDELEIQIAERTRALADANHVLQREIVERRQITEALQ